MREEAAWRYKLLILLGLVTLFALLKMFTLPTLLPRYHCLLNCLPFLNIFGAKIGVDWMEWVTPFRLL